MNILITELTVKNHINTLGGKNNLPEFLNIPFELDNGKLGNYKIKANIDRLNRFLKQLKTASSFYGKKTNRITSSAGTDNTIESQATFYVEHLKSKNLLFFPLKGSMLAASNIFRLETLRRIVPRTLCYSGHFSSDTKYLEALTEAAKSMGYVISDYIE